MRACSKTFELEKGVVPGEVRTHSVVVHGYRGAPAEDCDYLLSRLCDWLNSEDFRNDDSAWAYCLAVLRAVIADLDPSGSIRSEMETDAPAD